MSRQLGLGLDFGTSGARACVIAPGGEIEELIRLDFGALASHEQASAWAAALFDLLGQLPIGLRRRLAAVALDGTSGTVLACDADLGVLHSPLAYDDARAAAEAAEIAALAGAEHPCASASSGLAKVRWLQGRLARPAAFYLNQADWLTAQLADLAALPGARPTSDGHNALKLGFDPAAQAWPDWLPGLVAPERLPRVLTPGSAVAVVRRDLARRFALPADCLVRAGTTDSIAAFLASGARLPGEAVTSLGTTLVLKLVSRKAVNAAAQGIYSHWFGAYWLAGGASNAGGGVLAEYFDARRLAELSARIDPACASGLDYYPLRKAGERFPLNDPALPPRLTPRPADDAEFLHGLLEGLARIEALGYRRLAELGADPPRRVLSAGGGAGNPVYQAIRQRLLGVPVAISPQQEAAYGSARLAQAGTAIFPGP